MFLVWRGKGLVVPLLGIGGLIVMNLVVDGIGGKGTYEAHPFFIVLTFLIAAAITFFIVRNEEGRGDHFMFIPLRFFSVIFGVLAVGTLIVTSGQSSHAKPSEPPSAAEQPAPKVENAAMVTPSPVPPTPEPAAAPPPKTAPQPVATEEPEQPKLAQVYADNRTRTYYPENCTARPATALHMSKSVATAQGYTLAPACQ